MLSAGGPSFRPATALRVEVAAWNTPAVRVAALGLLLSMTGCATAPRAVEEPAADTAGPRWIWSGPHAAGGDVIGFGVARATEADPSGSMAERSARQSAAELLLGLFTSPSRPEGPFPPHEWERLSAELAEAAELVETWTSTSGRTFARARLTVAEERRRVERAEGYAPELAEGLERRMAALVPGSPEPPRWVGAPTEVPRRRVLSGRGQARGIINFSLGRSAADNRARSELSRRFQLFSEVFRARMFPPPPPGSGEQLEQAATVLAPVQPAAFVSTLRGAQIVERWYDARTGAHHARAELDLEPLLEDVRRHFPARAAEVDAHADEAVAHVAAD